MDPYGFLVCPFAIIRISSFHFSLEVIWTVLSDRNCNRSSAANILLSLTSASSQRTTTLVCALV